MVVAAHRAPRKSARRSVQSNTAKIGASGAGHAVVKDAVPAHAGDETVIAPRGDYEIEDCGYCVGLRHSQTKNRFTLSFDAFWQHLSEGRIAVAR